jgi:hypothetical protein
MGAKHVCTSRLASITKNAIFEDIVDHCTSALPILCRVRRGLMPTQAVQQPGAPEPFPLPTLADLNRCAVCEVQCGAVCICALSMQCRVQCVMRISSRWNRSFCTYTYTQMHTKMHTTIRWTLHYTTLPRAAMKSRTSK